MKINYSLIIPILFVVTSPLLMGTKPASGKHKIYSVLGHAYYNPKSKLSLDFRAGRNHSELINEPDDYSWKLKSFVGNSGKYEMDDVEFSLNPVATISEDGFYMFAHSWENEKHVCHVYDMHAQPHVVIFKTKNGKEVNCENTKGEWSTKSDHILNIIIDEKKTEEAFLQ